MAFVRIDFDVATISLGAFAERGDVGQGGESGDGEHIFVAFVGKPSGFDQGEVGVRVKAIAVLVKETRAALLSRI